MAAAFQSAPSSGRFLPLLSGAAGARALAFDHSGPICSGRFLADVHAVAGRLPEARHAINLCDDRYWFMVSFCAAALRGQINLLPHSRAPNVIVEALERYPQSYCLGESAVAPEPRHFHLIDTRAALPEAGAAVPDLPADQVVAIGFTSGSSGQPQANAKTWGSFAQSTARNVEAVSRFAGAQPQLVATVPPQHMYGLETSVLMPLLGGMAVHRGRPFFPADIAHALSRAQAPRVLVTTPVHLRALLLSGVTVPPLALLVSATAPLPLALAQQAEQQLGAPVLEMFGSTETCVIATRRTAKDDDWGLYQGVSLHPMPDGTAIDAPWFAATTKLQDIIEPLPGGRFMLQGRCSDLLEIAGKRASLGELTRRVLNIPGVDDAVVFQSNDCDSAGVRRICALVVAPALDEARLLAALRAVIDPVFLPRPLKRVAALPRNATGKLPRAELLRLLGGS
jgi:acyl-coenzyme A synthetase/AMP-(fatty) acid ligase